MRLLRTILWLVLVLFTWSVSPAAEKIPPQPLTGKIQWVYNYDEGKAAATASGKPLFVVFRCER